VCVWGGVQLSHQHKVGYIGDESFLLDPTPIKKNEKTDARTTRSSADGDNGLDAFVGQSRSKNILNPFQVKKKNNSE